MLPALCLLSLLPSTLAVVPFLGPAFADRASRLSSPPLNPYTSQSNRTSQRAAHKRSDLQAEANSTSFFWVLEDTYAGETFFDDWEFFALLDPTHGTVNYVDQSDAFSLGLAYVQPNGQVIMKGDDTTTLPAGVNRNSVRISSLKTYNGGLFILDLDRAPWGCGVWPAFWTLGNGTWPNLGEIDIIEGVHDNEHNQVTWHTNDGCNLTAGSSSNYTGSIVQTNGVDNLDCNGNLNNNAGCAITEWSQASYGPFFDSQGGGVFAAKWDNDSIAVYSFYRAAVPADITSGNPNPAGWGVPVAELSSQGCDLGAHFINHSIVFDITFCGDWAGNSYATSGCPGTCADRLMDPSNFVNASWIINSLKVYTKQNVFGTVSGASPVLELSGITTWTAIALLSVVMLLLDF